MTSPVKNSSMGVSLQDWCGWEAVCSQYIISDRQVYKIKMPAEPMMREEQINCTSSGALQAKVKDDAEDLNKDTKDEELHLNVEEDPRGVTQQSNQDNLVLYTIVCIQLRLLVCIPPCALHLSDISTRNTVHTVKSESIHSVGSGFSSISPSNLGQISKSGTVLKS